MSKAINISTIFPSYLFWDMDASKLDVKADRDIIIPRALFATTETNFEADITRLEALYTQKQIVRELKNTHERVSNSVCHLVAKRYHIPSFSRF
ncbi:MAG: hypothetical protein KF704_02075 [Crocinitomicaceae bacterium]|nr:hypothetical protein [Crocinitomicaceae bacterium]